jgi:hypothetical protein
MSRTRSFKPPIGKPRRASTAAGKCIQRWGRSSPKHGANRTGLPPYVAFQTSRTHIAYGGYLGQQYDPFISKGLKPLLPIFDHLITALVPDLEERGLLDDVLVPAMGEFGRPPLMGTHSGRWIARNYVWPSAYCGFTSR